MVSILILGAITAVFIVLSYIDFPILIIWAAAGYFAFRLSKQVVHTGCTVCWIKTILASIILLSLFVEPSFQMILGFGLLALLGTIFFLSGRSTKQPHKHH